VLCILVCECFVKDGEILGFRLSVTLLGNNTDDQCLMAGENSSRKQVSIQNKQGFISEEGRRPI